MALLWCVSLACLLALAGSDKVNVLNLEVDMILREISAVFDAEDTREVNLGEGKVTIGFLRCEGGRLGDLGTLKRTGDFNVSEPNPSVVIKASLGLGDFYIRYKSCKVSFGGYAISQPLNITVEHTSVTAQVTLSPDEQLGCVGHVDDLKVDQFSGVRLWTGDGFIHVVEDGFLKALVELLKNRALDTLVDRVWSAADRALGEGQVCARSKIPRLPGGDPDVL